MLNYLLLRLVLLVAVLTEWFVAPVHCEDGRVVDLAVALLIHGPLSLTGPTFRCAAFQRADFPLAGEHRGKPHGLNHPPAVTNSAHSPSVRGGQEEMPN